MRSSLSDPRYGTIRVGACQKTGNSCNEFPKTTSGLRVRQYTWTPPAHLEDRLPAGFSLSLRAVQFTRGGPRRLYPAESIESFIAKAFVVGLALLGEIKELSGPQVHSYQLMWQFFWRVRHSRDHLGNQLLNASSLRICWTGRELAQDSSILPERVGLRPQATGRPWSVGTLIRQGAAEAKMQGWLNPDQQKCIHLGLVRAARLDPLVVNENQVSGLVRPVLLEPLLAEPFSGPAGKTIAVASAVSSS